MNIKDYNNVINRINPSGKCREKSLNVKAVSSSTQGIQEYEYSVQGVERVEKINISHLSTLAATLVIIGCGVGFGVHGIKNMHSTDPLAANVSSFIDENINNNMQIKINSQLLIEGIDSDCISESVSVDNLEEVKAKMESIQWEKCDPLILDTDEYTSTKEFLWKTVELNDKGLLYNGTEYCYKAVNSEDAEELNEMLSLNMSPEMNLMISLKEGYKFRNMSGTYSALHTVPAEASETGESYLVTSKGTISVNKDIDGVMAEGDGKELGSNDKRRYAYLRYANDRVRYDEAHGEGESTAHYDGRELLPELDYINIYKRIVSKIADHINNMQCIHAGEELGENGEKLNTYNYAFTWTEDNEEKTMNVVVDEQGRLIKYILLAEDGHTLENFELEDDRIFDADDFEMPDMYEINR